MEDRKFEHPPFVYITIPLAIGVVLGYYYDFTTLIILALLCLILSSLIAFKRKVFEPLTCSLFLLLGIILINGKQPYCNLQFNQNQEFISTIETSPIKKGRYWRCEAAILLQRDSNVWANPKNLTQLNIDTSYTPKVGQVISYRSKNYAFDSVFQSYYNNKNIFSKQYVYNFTVIDSVSKFNHKIATLRNRLATKLEHLNPNDSGASAIVNSIVLGEKTNLDYSTKTNYRNTGLSHILAISGLHIGIIYIILSYWLSFISSFKHGLVIKFALIVLFLWGYAILSGLSASVLRAVIMFSLYGLGELMHQRKNSLNILLSSAFLILIFDPIAIFDLSFQLSYLAMFGITTIYKPAFYTLNPQNKIICWAWQIFVITCAAQIATAPIILYYFGQISLLGLVLNYLVWFTIPVIILFGGLFFITNIDFLGQISLWTASIQNTIIDKSANLNFGIIELKISLPVTILCYSILIVVITLLINYLNKLNEIKTSRQISEILKQNV